MLISAVKLSILTWGLLGIELLLEPASTGHSRNSSNLLHLRGLIIQPRRLTFGLRLWYDWAKRVHWADLQGGDSCSTGQPTPGLVQKTWETSLRYMILVDHWYSAVRILKSPKKLVKWHRNWTGSFSSVPCQTKGVMWTETDVPDYLSCCSLPLCVTPPIFLQGFSFARRCLLCRRQP